MKHRTFSWLALAALVVAGNTALMLWLEGGGAEGTRSPGAGRAALPPREDRAVARTLPEGAAEPSAPEGTPVRIETEPGASICIVPDRKAVRSPFPLEPLAAGTAGPDGVCVLVPSWRVRARVLVEMEGFAPAESPVRGSTVVLPLAKEGVIRGRVVEEGSGDLLAGAEVAARLGAGPLLRATAGGDGSFLLRGLRAGTWCVIASTGIHPNRRVDLSVASGGEAAVEIRLRRGVTLRGRVHYAGTDRVAGEGTISAGERSAPLGPDGRFELRGLPGPGGVFRVETGGMLFMAQGQRAKMDPATGEQVGEIEVPLPANNPSGLQFRGFVRDEEGRPVEGAVVAAGFSVLPALPEAHRGVPTGPIGEGATDATGRYGIASWASGNQILALHPGYAPTHLVLPWRSRNREFDIVLVRGAAVLVAVRDEEGRPAEGAEVYTFLRHPDPALAPTQYGDVQESLRAHPLTDGSGTAVLPRMGPGTWYLCARSADGRRGARAVLEVGKGARALSVDLVIRPLPWLGGRIVTRAGVPVPGIDVQVAGEEMPGPAVAARTGADGRFRFEGLAFPPWMPTADGVPVAIPLPIVGDGSTLLPLGRETEVVIDRP